MDILSTIAQSLDQQGLTDAAAFVRRLATEKSRVCAALGNPEVTAYIVGQLTAAGHTAAAQMAQRVGAAAAGICQVLSTSAALPSMAAASASFPALVPSNNPAPAAPASGGSCCGSCANGGSCSLKPPSGVDTCPPSTGVPSPTPGGPVAMSQDVGRWNCQQTELDLAPCDIRRITREEKLVSFTDTQAGPIAADSTIDIIFADIGVSHDLCVEYLLVENVTAGVGTAIPISQITLQGERIAEEGGGTFVHVWDYADPERPTYLGVTDGRCECKSLCAGIPAEGKARVQFKLPQEIVGGSSLRVTLWGRRSNWTRIVGPCKPCDQCDMVELTSVEQGVAENDMIVTAP